MRFRSVSLGALLAAATALPAAARGEDGAPAEEGPAVLLENARVLPVSGPPIPRGSILIRGGRIAAVGASLEAPPGARRVDLTGRTVCPGFLDAASRVSLAPSDRDGGARDPLAAASDGADLRDDALAAALRAGVTGLVLSPPAPRGNFAGRISLVKTAPSGGSRGSVAVREGALKAVLSPPGGASSLDRAAAWAGLRARFRAARDLEEARDRWRKDLKEFLEEAAVLAAGGDALEETLLPEAVRERLRRLDPDARERARRELRGRLGLKDPEKPPKAPKRPSEPRSDPEKDLLLAAVRGEVPVRFEAHAVEDLRGVLALVEEFGLRASVEGASEGPRTAAALARAGIPVVCWPVAGPGGDPEGPPAAAGPALLRKAGVAVAVATGDRGPLAVRHLPLLAAGAAGHGLSREDALRAVTLAAAEASGLADRLGSLAPGRDADLLVLDGDPLAVGTRVVAVWIDGVEVPIGEGER